MKRNFASFTINEPEKFKQQMLAWADQFSICCFLDSHHYTDIYHSYDCLVAVDAACFFSPEKMEWPALKTFLQNTGDWLFGHVNYDFNHAPSAKRHNHLLQFPPIFLFQPKVVVTLNGNQLSIGSLFQHPQKIYEAILNCTTTAFHDFSRVYLQPVMSKAQYISVIQQLKQHIVRGDCYEINYCQEFFSRDTIIDPVNIYNKLAQIAPNPFSAYYKLENNYLLCASPERYIGKKKAHLFSQPIKGTIKRSENKEADERLKKQLLTSNKDRSENVMVVDLVRNDFSKICKRGSVKVNELYGIYSYPRVHQMISTITGELKTDKDFADVLKATFPMGSMTGAPKTRVMQLIDQYEPSSRGIYSGAVGYITPEKDFDFNVVIRSIMYNADNKYLSLQVGGGITFYSDAEQEYEECLLKAEAINEVLNNTAN